MPADLLSLPHNVDLTGSNLISRYCHHTDFVHPHVTPHRLHALELLVCSTPVPDSTTCSSVSQTFPALPQKRSLDDYSELAASVTPGPMATHQQPLPTPAPTYLESSIDSTFSPTCSSIVNTDSPVNLKF